MKDVRGNFFFIYFIEDFVPGLFVYLYGYVLYPPALIEAKKTFERFSAV